MRLKLTVRRPRAATVIALLALFAALGGSAVAARHYLITSTRQIKPSVLKQLRGRTGASGPSGPRGPRGGAGSKGEAGLRGETGAKGETGSAGSTLWAVVKGDGTLARGAGTVSASRVNPEGGQYVVVFNRNIAQCAYIATLGSALAGSPPHGEIGVAGIAQNEDAVLVKTLNLKDEESSQPFHLAVLC